MTESDPRGALKRLAERTGGQFPNLWGARSLTEQELARVVKDVGRLSHDPDVSVVLFGSWARMELTPHSDDDWLILIDGPKRRELSPALADVGRIIGTEKRKPGKQKVFGIVASCNEMANKIGLNHDTNANLTRRVLLMLESVPVSNAAAHEACWDGVFDCYLREAHSGRPPRFLLNDVVRYWRTICVDFVGKQRESEAKWGTRNAKLRTSRKILFAAGLLPILQCNGLNSELARAFLVSQLRAPATDRLAHAFLAWGAADEGARCMEAYDRWIGMLNDRSVRMDLERLAQADADRSEVFQQVREIAKEIDRCLLMLLFETGLEPVSRQYCIF
jgi:predicted nucleotidyltransferase